jgi:hypothetical protein
MIETKPGELGQAFGFVCLELQGLHLLSFAATETEQRQKRLAAAS